MLYNIKTLPLHCVFHGIRFKVNEDWVSAIDTLLFLYIYLSFILQKKAKNLNSVDVFRSFASLRMTFGRMLKLYLQNLCSVTFQ